MLRNVLTICLTAMIVVLSLWTAASADTMPSGSVIVTTNPPGAQVTLTGDVIVSGVSPARFNQLLIGNYELTVAMFGYEKYRSRVTIDPSKEVTVDVRLTPKTRVKSLLRSAFIPGWGQRYVEQPKKGLLLTILAAGSVVYFLDRDKTFSDKKQDLDDLTEKYNHAVSIDERKRLAAQIATAHRDAYDAEDDRRIAIGAVIAAWGINVIDAIVFFPENRSTFSVKSYSTVNDGPGLSFGLTLSKAF